MLILQKTANGIHKRPDYHESTNISCISSHALKLKDFVEFVCVTITFFPNEELVYLVRSCEIVSHFYLISLGLLSVYLIDISFILCLFNISRVYI